MAKKIAYFTGAELETAIFPIPDSDSIAQSTSHRGKRHLAGKQSPATVHLACSASFTFERAAGVYAIATQYFDTHNGTAHFHLYVNGKQVDQWASDNDLPSAKMNGHTSTRHTSPVLALKTGDSIRIEDIPDHGDQAGIDYVEIEGEKTN